MKRFYYSAIRNMKECEGIIHADSIDSAKRKLTEDGYEEITLSILSSLKHNADKDGFEGTESLMQPPT